MLLAQENTGQRLDLDVYERVTLSLREPAHLFLNEDDVVDDLLVEARHDLGDACVVEAECFGLHLSNCSSTSAPPCRRECGCRR